MKLARLYQLGIAHFVIASEARQSSVVQDRSGLPRRCAPRNDGNLRIMKQPVVYIMANRRNGAVYTGVSSDLIKRVWQHKQGQPEGYTKLYNCKMLVWHERHSAMDTAIAREKQIKAGSRLKKLKLIEDFNPRWKDLYDDLVG